MTNRESRGKRYIEREIWKSSKYWYCIIYKTLHQGSLKHCKLDASCTLHQQHNPTEEWGYVHGACYWGCLKLHVLIHTSPLQFLPFDSLECWGSLTKCHSTLQFTLCVREGNFLLLIKVWAVRAMSMFLAAFLSFKARSQCINTIR